MLLSQQLAEYVSACFTGLWVQSHEHEDALAEIAQLCRQENWRLATWDIEQGLQVPGGADDATSEAGGADPLAAIRSVNALATPDGSALLVLNNFHRFLNSAEIVQALARQISHGKQNRTFVVVLSPVVQIPMLIPTTMTDFDEPHACFQQASSHQALSTKVFGVGTADTILRLHAGRFST